jgi:hypothetical protein
MQEISENPVQSAEKNIRRRRSHEEKIGRLKYNQQLLKRVLGKVEEVRDMQRIILNGLKGAGYFHFDRPVIERLACQDQVDLEICEILHEAGSDGVFPKDVAKELGQGLEYYGVSRRIVRMNKRLEHQTGERLFEKRGHRWALTRFAFEVWGETEEDEEVRECALTGPSAERE